MNGSSASNSNSNSAAAGNLGLTGTGLRFIRLALYLAAAVGIGALMFAAYQALAQPIHCTSRKTKWSRVSILPRQLPDTCGPSTPTRAADYWPIVQTIRKSSSTPRP